MKATIRVEAEIDPTAPAALQLAKALRAVANQVEKEMLTNSAVDSFFETYFECPICGLCWESPTDAEFCRCGNRSLTKH